MMLQKIFQNSPKAKKKKVNPCLDVDYGYGEPIEMLSSPPEGSGNCGSYIVRIPCGPRDRATSGTTTAGLLPPPSRIMVLEAIPEENPVIPDSNQVVDVHDPNEMVDILDDVDLVNYDRDDEENPEEDPEEDPKEEPVGGEYLSREFVDHMRSCGIVSHLTLPYIPQHNGVSERRNQTLLEMVRSLMNSTTLPKSFWGYALEFAARILNMVLTKKEMMGYYFYNPYENKIFVARYAEFFENSLTLQESSGSDVRLELIKDNDTQPWNDTSEQRDEVEPNEVEPYTMEIPIRGSERISQAPDRYGFYVDVEEHKLGVDLPPNGGTVRSKWLFKKKTDMDGNVHTFKARLVAKGYTQPYSVDYGKIFSPVADIRTIRILLAIVAFYDYEIWQMDVKTAFLNGHLARTYNGAT
ncbi:retrotransposon protein, putative, ty1-copia subclass [Tanacetum coccineum]